MLITPISLVSTLLFVYLSIIINYESIELWIGGSVPWKAQKGQSKNNNGNKVGGWPGMDAEESLGGQSPRIGADTILPIPEPPCSLLTSTSTQYI